MLFVSESVNEAVHARRIPRAQKSAVTRQRIPRYLLNPGRESSRKRSSSSNNNNNNQDGGDPQESQPLDFQRSGTILDILKTRQEIVVENMREYSEKADWLPGPSSARNRDMSPGTTSSSPTSRLPGLVRPTSPGNFVAIGKKTRSSPDRFHSYSRGARVASSYPPPDAPSLISLLYCYRRASFAS